MTNGNSRKPITTQIHQSIDTSCLMPVCEDWALAVKVFFVVEIVDLVNEPLVVVLEVDVVVVVVCDEMDDVVVVLMGVVAVWNNVEDVDVTVCEVTVSDHVSVLDVVAIWVFVRSKTMASPWYDQSISFA